MIWEILIIPDTTGLMYTEQLLPQILWYETCFFLTMWYNSFRLLAVCTCFIIGLPTVLLHSRTVKIISSHSIADLKLIYIIPTILFYILAKILEVLDLKSNAFYKVTMKGIISGHSLKHIAAGISTVSFMYYIMFT